MKNRVRLSLILVLPVILTVSCQKETFSDVFFEEDELLISDYLEAHRDDYSSMIRVLELTGLKATLNAYGHYTFFVPDNQAFDDFCTDRGKASLDEFDVAYLTNLVKYHLLNVVIESAYFNDGVIQDTTFSGDHLVVTFSEGGLETIMVNDAMIAERDIHVENGIIHRMDKVLDPIVGSIVDRLKGSGSFSIFSDALELAGLADSLDIITINLTEDIHYRSRFTLFVEPDDIYIENGISDAQDLVERYSDSGDPASRTDGFYQYVAYHIIPDLCFLNEIDSFNYRTLDGNMLINVKLEDRIFLNWHKDELGREEYITVLEGESNQQAKNGTFHVIDKIMEPYEPEPVYMIIDLTNYQGISLGHEYTEKELEDIEGIRTENTGIWFRNSILADGETNLQTTEERVGWVVEFELPPIIKGKYDVYFNWASHPINSDWAQAFWDGARMGNTFSFEHQKRWPGQEWKRDFNTSQYMGRLLLTETEPHTIKFVSLLDGYGNFDYLAFWPVTE
jgi:uncharacterized surface protein with fasciclin (FAS1) repeats